LIRNTKNRVFYGWIIVAATLISICGLFGVRFSFGIFFKSLQGEFELTRAATSSIFSAYMILAAVFGIVTGWALDKYGPKLVVSLMGFLTGLSLLITSQATSSWHLFLSYSLLLSMGTSGTMAAFIPVISRWFDKKRGIAIGIATSGTGLGTLIIAPTAAYLISSTDWRTAYQILGLAVWVIVISAAMLLKRDPREISSLPDGVKSIASTTDSANNTVDAQLIGHSFRQALKTRQFWFVFGTWLSFATCLSLIMTHVVPYATDLGISLEKAATVISLIGAFQIISRLAVGRISDITGRKIPGIACALIGICALIWLIWSRELWMFYTFAITFGIAYGGIGVINLSLAGDIFGRRNLGTIMGALEVAFATGSAIGSFLGGYLFDVTESYVIAFAIGASTILVLALIYIAIAREEIKSKIDEL